MNLGLSSSQQLLLILKLLLQRRDLCLDLHLTLNQCLYINWLWLNSIYHFLVQHRLGKLRWSVYCIKSEACRGEDWLFLLWLRKFPYWVRRLWIHPQVSVISSLIVPSRLKPLSPFSLLLHLVAQCVNARRRILRKLTPESEWLLIETWLSLPFKSELPVQRLFLSHVVALVELLTLILQTYREFLILSEGLKRFILGAVIWITKYS